MQVRAAVLFFSASLTSPFVDRVIEESDDCIEKNFTTSAVTLTPNVTAFSCQSLAISPTGGTAHYNLSFVATGRYAAQYASSNVSKNFTLDIPNLTLSYTIYFSEFFALPLSHFFPLTPLALSLGDRRSGKQFHGPCSTQWTQQRRRLLGSSLLHRRLNGLLLADQ